MTIGRTLLVAASIALFSASACSRSEAPSSQTAGTSTASSPASTPFGFLNTPTENQLIAPGTFVSGWALDKSGIADVTVIFDDGQKSFVKRGEDFPGVKTQYSDYPDADRAGYLFAIPKMSAGPHSLTVTVKGRSGGTLEIQRHFRVT